MEAARILSQYEFERTLVFIGFDREEQGLWGSRAYAQEHSDDDIFGMISMDMIAYNGSGANKVTIAGQSTSSLLKQALADAVTLYGNGMSSEIYGALNGSDHYPFETEGFQACLLIENNYWENPHYHQLTDSVDTPNYIDYGFATNAVRSAAGFLAAAAIPIPEPGTFLLLSIGLVILRRK
ncbi:MAG: M28 family peptidase [Planctomycetota bacterium]